MAYHRIGERQQNVRKKMCLLLAKTKSHFFFTKQIMGHWHFLVLFCGWEVEWCSFSQNQMGWLINRITSFHHNEWKHHMWISKPSPLNIMCNLYKHLHSIHYLFIFVVNFLFVSFCVEIPNVQHHSRRERVSFLNSFSRRRIFPALSKKTLGRWIPLSLTRWRARPVHFCRCGDWNHSVGGVRMNASGSFCGWCHWRGGGRILPATVRLST